MKRRVAVLGAAITLVGAAGGCGESDSQPARSAESKADRVTHVIDGDTVETERLGRVRLIGVDTPEEERCFENAATRFTRERLEGQAVTSELGVERKDRHGRTLAYLSRDGDMHNLALLTEGYAKVLTIPPNDKYAQRFEEAEREARKADAGAWDTCDRNKIRARRAAARRRAVKRERARAAAAARRRIRAERRAARAAARRQARRQRAEERRRQRAAQQAPSGGGDSGGGGGDTSGPSSSNWCGKRDGDGDGIYCE